MIVNTDILKVCSTHIKQMEKRNYKFDFMPDDVWPRARANSRGAAVKLPPHNVKIGLNFRQKFDCKLSFRSKYEFLSNLYFFIIISK